MISGPDERPVVATGGSIDRDDRCSSCGGPMLYAVDAAGKVHDSFCGNFDCSLCLVAIAE